MVGGGGGKEGRLSGEPSQRQVTGFMRRDEEDIHLRGVKRTGLSVTGGGCCDRPHLHICTWPSFLHSALLPTPPNICAGGFTAEAKYYLTAPCCKLAAIHIFAEQKGQLHLAGCSFTLTGSMLR